MPTGSGLLVAKIDPGQVLVTDCIRQSLMLRRAGMGVERIIGH